jgi:hypothetical protein
MSWAIAGILAYLWALSCVIAYLEGRHANAKEWLPHWERVIDGLVKSQRLKMNRMHRRAQSAESMANHLAQNLMRERNRSLTAMRDLPPSIQRGPAPHTVAPPSQSSSD